MLTISKAISSSQAQTYHAKEFTSAEQNYWKQGDSIQGEWHGKLAETFGLSEVVNAQDFARLSEGQHPATGDQLVRHRKVQEYETDKGKTVAPIEHRAGWDATFSAPKSISVAALVGGDERIREAHRRAVDVALNEMEKYTQARLGGNKAPATTGKFVAAKFEHDTARPVDGYAAPQLHTHVVIFNMTQLEDGKTRALQERAFFDSQRYATAIYQSQLTYQLRNLGYEIVPGRSGAPEISGFTQEYLDASSPRRQQILEAVERSGFTGHEAARIAAYGTRDKKQILSPAEVFAAHRQIGAEHGYQADRVRAEAWERQREHQNRPTVIEREKRAHAAVTFARDRNFEREAVVDERALFVDALRRGMGDVTYSEVRHNFNSRVASGEFKSVANQKHQSGQGFTTREMIAAEREVLSRVIDGQDKFDQIAPIEHAVRLTEVHQRLNPTQKRVVEEVLTSRDQVHGLQGVAGSGKTTALAVVREGAEANGYVVEGFAPTSRAANQLRDASISADTLQGFLARTRAPNDPASKHLYMVDESSFTSTQQMRDFLRRIGSEDKVLLIGDTRQHQGVDAGKPFEQLQHADMRTAHLDMIVRQKDEGLLRAVEHLSKHETFAAMDLLNAQGRVTEVSNRQDRIATIAQQYMLNPDKTIVVSPDNASRQEINQVVRRELQKNNLLSHESKDVAVLIPRSDMTGADRRWASQYHVGDVLHYVRGSVDAGIERGSYATVRAVDEQANQITVRKGDGTEVHYDPKRLQGIVAYEKVTREFAVGDKIQMTAPLRELQVANRDLGTIKELDDNSMTITLHGKNARELSFDLQKAGHFDHGYAVTSHSSQGLTAERVLVNMDTRVHPELINPRFAYVSISRASHEAHVYTDNTDSLNRMLTKNVSKTTALQPDQNLSRRSGIVKSQAGGELALAI